MSATRGGWDTEIARLHEMSPGITETVLSSAVSRGTTPYGWLMEGAGSPERVLDLGCGSAPMCARFEGKWVGLDASSTELVNAGNHARGPLVQALIEALPIRSGALDLVVSSLALMLVDDLRLVLSEITRVMRPGGSLRLLLPARSPLSLRDWSRYLRLQSALHLTSLFPESTTTADAELWLGAGGLRVLQDERRRFQYPIDALRDADVLVDSLYTPMSGAARRANAKVVAASWMGSSIGIPLRRVVASRAMSGT